MANRSIKRPVGIIDDVLVKVGKFLLPADFMILDCAVDKEILSSLGGHSLLPEEHLWIRNEMKSSSELMMKKSPSKQVEDASEVKMEEECLGEALAAILVNFDGENMEGYMESMNALKGRGSYTYAPKKLSLDLQNRATPPAKPSIIEPPQLELKPLPPHLSYNQINIALEDQEKTTFTCLYGTFAFIRMPFGLCNAPATFQRCMMSIFSDMVEDFLEVFMDDFSIVGDSFEHCLDNLRQVLKRCEETNLVLNWEK
uniref:Reverse transcriptase domain-containing protein n=1 Tax=Nicotiana tabacum TaxID=4097 RepID=A0A1S4CXQ3_TOBAC|nr:PREDICTED: uncharacterized protein LOC107823629 [Nicotiana tabacum]